MKKINKVLVANRGEIALRIMRTCREMGINTVAVYSEADRQAPFTRYADEAVCIGPPPSAQSYLVPENILKAAKQTKADAIHPGYGFLSENSKFAAAVEKAGFIFIGPSPESMDTMGDKLSAKAAVKKFNIPMVPGSEGAITSLEEGKKIASETGFPLLIKASAGGGGKGMKIVEKPEEFEEQMKRFPLSAMEEFLLNVMSQVPAISRSRSWATSTETVCIFLKENVPFSDAIRKSLRKRLLPF